MSALVVSSSSSMDCVSASVGGYKGGGGISIDTAGGIYIAEPTAYRVRAVGEYRYCASPSPSPSATPTFSPTNPTSLPSSQPTLAPSCQPTSRPSTEPSSQPSRVPSGQPSITPTISPSVFPTTQPSSDPSKSPTSQPTTVPTSQPVSYPSTTPSQQPSSRPSAQPFSSPTSQPSTQPTSVPSSQPVCHPTERPLGSLETKRPSVLPTFVPSVCPTVFPTYVPTVSPSVAPMNLFLLTANLSSDAGFCDISLSSPVQQAFDSSLFLCGNILSFENSSFSSLLSIQTCLWSSGSVLRMLLSSEVNIGDFMDSSVSLRVDQVFSIIGNLGSAQVVERYISVTQPLNTISPYVQIDLPRFSCLTVEFDTSQTTGSCNRAWSSASVRVNISNSSPVITMNLTKIENALKREWLSTSDGILRVSHLLFQDANNLEFNGTVSIFSTLCNVLQACSRGEVVFNYNSALFAGQNGYPTIKIAPTTRFVSVKTADWLYFTADAFVTQCSNAVFSRQYAGISVMWEAFLTHSNGSRNPLRDFSISNNPRSLRIPPFTLSPGSNYSLQVIVTDIASGLSSISSTITVICKVGSLVARLVPNQPQVSLPTGASIVFDASQSYDSDLPQGGNATLWYNWTCAPVSSLSSSVCPLRIRVRDNGRQLVVSATNTTVVDQESLITLSVLSKLSANRPVATATAKVIAVVSPVPIIRILTPAAALTKVSTRANAEILATVTLPLRATTSVTAVWSLSGGNSASLSSIALGVTSPIVLEPGQTSTMNLLFRQSVLESGAQYLLRLTAGSLFTTVSMSTNYPPYGGIFNALPRRGLALETPFTLSALHWTDDVEDLPLRYAFFFQTPGSTSNQSASVTSTGAMVSTTGIRWLPLQLPGFATSATEVPLPVGLWNYSLLLQVSVYDILDAAASSTTSVVVRPANSSQSISSLLAYVYNATQISSISTQQAIATVLGFLDNSIYHQQQTTNVTVFSASTARALKLGLSLALNASMTNTDNGDVLLVESLILYTEAITSDQSLLLPSSVAAIQDVAEVLLRGQLTAAGTTSPISDTSLTSLARTIDNVMVFLLSNDTRNETSATFRKNELGQSVELTSLIAGLLSTTRVVQLTLQTYQVSISFPVVGNNNTNALVTLPLIVLPPSENTFDSSSLSITIGTNASTTKDVVAVTVTEFNRDLWTAGQVNKTGSSSELASNIVTVEVGGGKTNSNTEVTSVTFVANISHVRDALDSVDMSEYLAPPVLFSHNCSIGVVETVQFSCPGSNVALNLSCFGNAAATVTRSCPVKRFVCNVLDLKDFVVSDRSYCRATISTRTYTVCECGNLGDETSRRLATADDDIYTGGSSSGGKGNDVSSSAVSVAVMSEYVAGGFASTVTKTQTVSSSDVSQRSTTIFALFGLLWGIGVLLVVFQVRMFDSVFVSMGQFVNSKNFRNKKVDVVQLVPISDQGAVDSGKPLPSAVNNEVDELFAEYVESVIPRVYRPRPFIARLWFELCERHSYLKVFLTVFKRDQMKETMLEVGELLTNITLSLLLLAVLYDVQYPVDDGSCAQYTTQQMCLDRKSILDASQTFCVWSLKIRRQPAMTVGRFRQLEILLSGLFSVTLEEDITLSSQDPVFVCEFHEYASSFQAAIVVAVVTSCFTALLMRPLQFIFSVLRAKTKQEIASRIAASQLSTLLGQGSGQNRRQTTMLSVVPTGDAGAMKNDFVLGQENQPGQQLHRRRGGLTSVALAAPSAVPSHHAGLSSQHQSTVPMVEPYNESAQNTQPSEPTASSTWMNSLLSMCGSGFHRKNMMLTIPEETRAARRQLLEAYNRLEKTMNGKHQPDVPSMVDNITEAMMMEMVTAGHLCPPLLKFLSQWQQQREDLAKSNDSSRLISFETAWMPFIPTADIVMAAAPYQQVQSSSSSHPVMNSIPLASLDPRSAEQRKALIAAWKRARTRVQQIRQILSLATETESGVVLLQMFLADLLGTDSPAAKFFMLAVAKDFAAHATVASDIFQYTCLLFVIMINGFALYFVLLRGVQQGPTWQYAFLLACVAQIFTEILFFIPLEVFYVDVFLPSFAFSAVQRAQQQASRLSQYLTQQSMLLTLDVPGVFFPSRIVVDSKVTPQSSSSSGVTTGKDYSSLMETNILRAYRTLWPAGSLRKGVLQRQKAQDISHQHSSISLWHVFDGEYLMHFVQQSSLSIVTLIPLEAQRILVRFFEPFLLGGLILLWFTVAQSTMALIVFIVVTAVVVVSTIGLCIRSPAVMQQPEKESKRSIAAGGMSTTMEDKDDLLATMEINQQRNMNGYMPVMPGNHNYIPTLTVPLPLGVSSSPSAANRDHVIDYSDGEKKNKKQQKEKKKKKKEVVTVAYEEGTLNEEEDIERYRKPSSSEPENAYVNSNQNGRAHSRSISFDLSPPHSPASRRRLLSNNSSNGNNQVRRPVPLQSQRSNEMSDNSSNYSYRSGDDISFNYLDDDDVSFASFRSHLTSF